MKKSLFKRPGQVLRLAAVICGLAGLALRFWLEADAIDGKGLLILSHPAHLSLWAPTSNMPRRQARRPAP